MFDIEYQHACASRVRDHHAEIASPGRGDVRGMRALEAALAAWRERELGIDQAILEELACPSPGRGRAICDELGERLDRARWGVERLLAGVRTDLDRAAHVRIEVPRHAAMI